MFHYEQVRQCDICRKKKECWHFDIYSFGSEGIILCFECIIDVLRNCELDENIEARRIIGHLIANLSMSEFRNQWKAKFTDD